PSSTTPTPTTQTYPLSLHDALPIWARIGLCHLDSPAGVPCASPAARSSPRLTSPISSRFWAKPWQLECDKHQPGGGSQENHTYPDRKSTRLNSSHLVNSYAVFCLKK